MTSAFWSGKRVLVTGHTGFKGGWLAWWLHHLGAKVSGYSLPAPTSPSLFELTQLSDVITSFDGDIRDAAKLRRAFEEAEPEVVFHLAAQPIVRASYDDPVETYDTNVLGTMHVLEAMRRTKSLRVGIVVTSDKCYENREWEWGYREIDALGGHDPYSSSKACAEILTASYRRSFFGPEGAPRVATVRAGNVIGGGDWAKDRIVPDAVRAFSRAEALLVRNPSSTRPWQHVLEPLSGYLDLAAALTRDAALADAWNFGPHAESVVPVSRLVGALADGWGEGARWVSGPGPHPHEARSLKLDWSKAREHLGWRPRLGFEAGVTWTLDWYRAVHRGESARASTLAQIARYEELS